MANVIFCHATRGKPSFELVADTTAIQLRQAFDRLQSLLLIVDDKTGHAMLDNFWHGAATEQVLDQGLR